VKKIALQQKAPVIVLVLLIAAMLFTLALEAYEFFMPPSSQLEERSIESINSSAVPPRPERKIDKLELFGAADDQSQQDVAVRTEDLPKTNLRLILRGVSASKEIERVSALIEGPNKETLKYSINDTLPGNAKLKSVHEKRIVIERNGRLENLYFPDDINIGIVRNENTANADQRTPQQGSINQSPQQRRSSQPLAAPHNYARPAANLDALSEERKNEIKHRLELLREKMKQTHQ
jgi:general secretion pathway protein C